MKRVLLVIAVVAFVVIPGPVAAQFLGMPLWNSPKGGTGVTLNGDVGLPNEDWGKGTAFGGRVTLGLANIALTGGLASWKPDTASESFSSVGGNVAFRIIGGSLLPIAINLQLGGARIAAANAIPARTRLTAAAGASMGLPTPGVSIEPYVAVGNRWNLTEGGGTESNFGWTVGANLGFGGFFGLHIAYDAENAGGGVSMNVIGVGAHISLRAPIGL
jgi:hypothetical protein